MSDILIEHVESDEWESVRVSVAGAVIEVTTSYDCPEDNTAGRLGLVEAFKSFARALGLEYSFTRTWE